MLTLLYLPGFHACLVSCHSVTFGRFALACHLLGLGALNPLLDALPLPEAEGTGGSC